MNIGLHDGILDSKHEDAMGSAIWLYLWCVARQTKRSGLVLGGMPLTYAEISKRSGGFPERKLRRWLPILRSAGYLAVEYLNFKMMRISVLKSKKFDFKQARLDFRVSPEKGQRLGQPKTEYGHSLRPKTVYTPTKKGQSKQSGSMKYIESTTTTKALPDGIAALVPIGLWLDFLAMRKAKRKPMTSGAVVLFVRELLRLQSEGQDPTAVVEQSIMNGWTGIFPVKGSGNGKQESFSERQQRKSKEALDRVDAHLDAMDAKVGRRLPYPSGQ